MTIIVRALSMNICEISRYVVRTTEQLAYMNGTDRRTKQFSHAQAKFAFHMSANTPNEHGVSRPLHHLVADEGALVLRSKRLPCPLEHIEAVRVCLRDARLEL